MLHRTAIKTLGISMLGDTLKRAIVMTVVALAAYQQADSQEASSRTSLKIRSTVGDLRVLATTRLPANRKRAKVDEDCSQYEIAHPKSLGGRLARRNGWIVTSETKLGSYDAVTFVGALERAWIPPTCAHVNGNIAVFDGAQLKAIAYEVKQRRPIDPSEGVEVEDSLAFAEQIDRHRIRLSWGLPLPPFADMVLRDDISVEPIAKEDRVCGGLAAVPNVFGEDIRQARKKLLAYGWRPVRSTSESGAIGSELRGVIEVESCSGVGYGFCGFNYRHKKGFGLGVVTTGDGYPVISYGAQCGAGKKPANRHGRS